MINVQYFFRPVVPDVIFRFYLIRDCTHAHFLSDENLVSAVLGIFIVSDHLTRKEGEKLEKKDGQKTGRLKFSKFSKITITTTTITFNY